MIETQAALDNIDAIMGVEELDAIYIGPADLSLSLHVPPKFDPEDGPVAEAIDFILKKAQHHGKIAGMHTAAPDYALKMVQKGFQFVTIASDARLMAARAQEVVGKMRAGMKAGKPVEKVVPTTGAY
jgi:4-hydroxy-2-oxoheptanedioate aldolase